MITKLLGASLLAALSTTAMAGSPAQTHKQISVPGKAIVAYRPLAKMSAAAEKCHPDATKAVACEARAQQARLTALASTPLDAEAPSLSQR